MNPGHVGSQHLKGKDWPIELSHRPQVNNLTVYILKKKTRKLFISLSDYIHVNLSWGKLWNCYKYLDASILVMTGLVKRK